MATRNTLVSLESVDGKRSQISLDKQGDVVLGGSEIIVMAGPCSAESKEQLLETAKLLRKLGVKVMRASAFKPRSSPYSFQGHGRKALDWLDEVRKETGILVETEIMDVRDVAYAADRVDILRVGARNAQNYDLLKELGKVDIPVVLKRGLAMTIEEWLMSAEYILQGGNSRVIFCERGIRTFETSYRNTLDIAAIPVLRGKTHLPVIVDPSHAAGSRELVESLSCASVAAGADGLLVEMHLDPDNALSDGQQSLDPKMFEEVLKTIKPVAKACNKTIS